MRTMTWWMVVAALGIATGCGTDPVTPGDAGVTADSGLGVDGGLRADGGGTTGDGNDSFADAEDVTLGTATELTNLDPEGDVDYYQFEGTAGQWIGVSTETAIAMDADAPGIIDTVVTLFDGSMTQIAENDDALPRQDTDSTLITRLPAAGTYYVRVQDYNTWRPAEPPVDRVDFDYSITVFEIGGANVTVDGAANDTVAQAQPITLMAGMAGTARNGFIAGTAATGTDVDVYSFTVSAGVRTNFYLQPGGTTGSGSTGLPTQVRITNAAGDQIVARITTTDSVELTPALPAGDYLLWIDPPAAAGANAFYFLNALVDGEDNPAETMELTNGVALTPEALTGTGPSYFILATLGAADVDYYSFPVVAGQAVSITCGSRTNGSGIVGLSLELQTAAGVAVASGSATETAMADATINDVAVPAAGTYLLRLSAASQDADVTGNGVRCGVHPAAPTP